MGIDRLDDIERLELQTARQAELERRITEMNNEKCALYERYITGEIGRDEYWAAKSAIDAEYDRLLLANAAYKEEARLFSERANSGDKLQKLAVTALTSEVLTRPLVDPLIERVYVFPGGRIEIRWVFADFAEIGK